jgi:pyridoxal phosphate enzyme (YggS family)
MYDMGFRDMGENRVQDLLDKKDHLPIDINWHIIGTLQRNKVKYIADFIHKIHSVDSVKLAIEINKQAKNHNRRIPILLQFKVAEEESKHGISPNKKEEIVNKIISLNLENIEIQGIMGMASFSDDKEKIKSEFLELHRIYTSIKNQYINKLPFFNELSMGMSGDYELALECGSTIVRLGSILFNSLDNDKK